MIVNRPFAYNPSRITIDGTLQVGDLAIGVTNQGYSNRPGGVIWWGGPDESIGYVICMPVPTMDFSTPIGDIGTVQFWRSIELTNNSFLSLVNHLSGGVITGITEIQGWIDTNEYWTSWNAPSPIQFIDCGSSTSFGLSENGQVWGWGYNQYGQIGDNSLINRYAPVSIQGNKKTFCHISSGNQISRGIDNNGQIWVWGGNSQTTPVSITGNKKTFCKISTGYDHSMVIEYNGQVWGWGNNNYGQIGDNYSEWMSLGTPVSIHGNKKTFCQISTGKEFTIAIQHNGQVWGWGNNSSYELGDGTQTNRCTPVSLYSNKTFCKITSGEYHSVGLDKNGQSWVWGTFRGYGWGNNYYTVPTLVNNKTFCQISSGPNYTLSIEHNGQVWGWGHNYLTQLGVDTILINVYYEDYVAAPISIHGNKKTFCQISAGSSYAIGLEYNGNIWGWGDGFIGDGYDTRTPVSIYGNEKTYCEISSSDYNTFIIQNDGQVWGWGYNGNLINYSGILGDDTTKSRRTPISILGNKKTFCQISVNSHVIGIDQQGQVWGWGYNGSGQLGINESGYYVLGSFTPVSIHGNKKTFCKIATGYANTIGIQHNGQVWTWGYNWYGQLGINEQGGGKFTPVSIHGNKKTFCQITSNSYYYLGIEHNGQVWGWGYNERGQIGDNSVIDKCTPVSIHGNKKTFCKIKTNGDSTTSIDYNGQIWSWGNNNIGQLGDNSIIESRLTPVSLHGNKKTFCEIDVSIGIDKYGQVWTWGINIGDSSYNNNTPVSILGNKKTFCNIQKNSEYCMGLEYNGQVWAWGSDYKSELGINHYTGTPVRVCNI